MKALLLIDIQVDFCPGGALAVAHGDEVVPVANRLIEDFSTEKLPVIATQDWHPLGHVSFASAHPGHAAGDVIELPSGTQQVLWPDHCVQNSRGAEFDPGLEVERITHVVHKGTDPAVDSYSAFFDNERVHATDLDAWLRAHDVDDLTICGLACDYCVKYSALDARSLGYTVTLVRDGTRPVEAAPGDGERAIAEMSNAGVLVI